MNDAYDRTVSVALKYVGELEQKAYELAEACQKLIEGGDPEDACVVLLKYHYINEDGVWIR